MRGARRRRRDTPGPIPEWRDAETLVVAGEVLSTGYGASDETRLVVRKPRHLIDKYVELLGRTAPRRVVEIGIAQGGSVALTSLVADPEVLVGVELAPTRIAALDRLQIGRAHV